MRKKIAIGPRRPMTRRCITIKSIPYKSAFFKGRGEIYVLPDTGKYERKRRLLLEKAAF